MSDEKRKVVIFEDNQDTCENLEEVFGLFDIETLVVSSLTESLNIIASLAAQGFTDALLDDNLSSKSLHRSEGEASDGQKIYEALQTLAPGIIVYGISQLPDQQTYLTEKTRRLGKGSNLATKLENIFAPSGFGG